MESPAQPPHDRAALNREKARLRKIGAVILTVGWLAAGILYCARRENPDLDQYQQSLTRSESRQMAIMYGTSGSITEDITSALKRPGPQALLIAAVTGIFAAGCLYIGQPLPEDRNE